MGVSQDYRDLFRALNDCRVRYLVVGAHAFGYHAEPRFTRDLDVWVDPSPENALRVYQALAAFGAPLQGISVPDFAVLDLVYQIGVPPCRVDVMTGISGVRFASAWRNRKRTEYGGVPIQVLGRSDLIRNKRASGRPQDLLDVQQLERSRRHPSRKKRRKRK
jgi:hypothetical protein